MTRYLALAAGLMLATAASAADQAADSLPAFRTDSAAADPFRKAEAGPSPWSNAQPGAKADTGSRRDTVTARLTHRHPAISVWLGADFSDLDAKEAFNTSLTARILRDSATLAASPLQGYEPVHLSFPVGIQGVFPLGNWFDAVAKTRFSTYKQLAILGDKNKRSAGEEWYAVQANLGGLGLRYYIPPSLFSVTGGLAMYAQGVILWNLGGTEIYTPYGTAPARFQALGSGYELQFGLHQALKGPWRLAGSIGFVQQDHTSDSRWDDIMRDAAPSGRAHWSSSAVQANLALWFHFGVPSDSTAAKSPAAAPVSGAAPVAPTANPASISPSVPAPAP